MTTRTEVAGGALGVGGQVARRWVGRRQVESGDEWDTVGDIGVYCCWVGGDVLSGGDGGAGFSDVLRDEI
jgi:hypothetical protein